ncbi:MAG: carbohydrate ABC transporter permease, partial [Parvibaculaceae bacterium]
MTTPRPKLDPGYSSWTPFRFLAPAVLALLAIGIYPTLFAIVTSFREYQLTRPRSGFPFIGLDNYKTILFDSTFRESLFLTFKFFLFSMPCQLVLGLAIALLLHQPGAGLLRSVARVALVVPLATTNAVVGLNGRLMFNRDFGDANEVLSWFG